jgi:hypothetical protein
MTIPTFSIRTFEPEGEGMDMVNIENAHDRVIADGTLWCSYSEVQDLIMQVQYATRQSCLRERK